MHEIRIATDKIEMLTTLNDSPTAERIWDALPIDSTVNTWGQEIYFSIPVQCDLDLEARDRMEVGEVGYWPTGSAFCIFFGRTPASKGDEPRAASPVNPIGRCEGDIKVFRQVRESSAVRIERIEEETDPVPGRVDEAPPAEADAPTQEPPAEAADAGKPEASADAGKPEASADAEPGEVAQNPDAAEPGEAAQKLAAAEPGEDADKEKPAEEA